MMTNYDYNLSHYNDERSFLKTGNKNNMKIENTDDLATELGGQQSMRKG